jgi:N-acetylmuramic acid 6-phosphate etherase
MPTDSILPLKKPHNLDKMSVKKRFWRELNNEDKTVPYAVEKAIPQIEVLVTR